MHLRRSVILVAAAFAPPTLAADLELKIELPRINVAEYHVPYVAVWLEKADESFAGNLAVWYDMNKRNNEGNKWLKDLRSWWRKSGRELSMPVDSISGATRAAGAHTVQFPGGKSPLDKLAPGQYQLVVEAARESGGREQVKVPFQWPPKSAASSSAKGGSELGAINVSVKP